MPIQTTYPGVYIEEVPSGVRTITGVATSITAFIGRALRGPLNDPVTINNFGDFERQFGGVWVDSMMSYAVRDFYQNGGSRAVIVRTANAATSATIALPTKTENKPLILEAISPGAWGNKLMAMVDYKTSNENDGKLFNLIITEGKSITETFLNVSTDPGSPRYLPGVLEQLSALVRVQTTPGIPEDRPLETKEIVIKLPAGPEKLLLKVSNEGSKISAVVDYKDTGDNTDLFNLTITEGGGKPNETFQKTSIDKLKIAINESKLVQIKGELPKNRPAETPAPVLSEVMASPASIVNASVGDKADGIVPTDSDYLGKESDKTGIYALLNTEFNLLCIPPAERGGDTTPQIYQTALNLCMEKRAMLLVDPPAAWGTSADKATADAEKVLNKLSLAGDYAKNVALYFPRVRQTDPKRDGQTDTFVPCGLVAGVIARTDATRGVWKSPAGLDASLNGIQGLQVNLTDEENGKLNPLGINCLRQFPVNGRVVWGARTLRGADQLADTDNKYIAVRRTTLFIEESLYRGTQWVVFEPNDEPLWSQIRLNVGAFMHNLFRQGAFQGRTPKEAYLVKCDKETTTQTDINQGVVNVLVGFAPLKPAEFVYIRIQQLSGQVTI